MNLIGISALFGTIVAIFFLCNLAGRLLEKNK